jgi:hypothetical protein
MSTRLDLGRPLVALHRTDLATLAIVGGLLSLSAPAAVPAVLLSGYLVRTLGGAIRGDDRPPTVGDWRATARHGLAATGLVAVVSLPALAARAATTRLAVRRLPLGPGLVGAVGSPTAARPTLAPAPVAVPGAALLVGVAATVGLAVVAAYASTLAVGIYAATGSIRAALSPGRLLAAGRSGATALAAVGCVAVAGAAALAGRLAAFVPVGGPFVGAVVTFLGSVVAVRLYGRNAELPTPADVGRAPDATPAPAPDPASDAAPAERDACDRTDDDDGPGATGGSEVDGRRGRSGRGTTVGGCRGN